jgi:hypothetical protein
MFVEGQAFLQSYDLAPHPLPPLPSVRRQQVVSLSQSFCVSRSSLLTGGAVGEEPNLKSARKPGPL